MLTSKQRAYLRSMANGLDAIFQVGKNNYGHPNAKVIEKCVILCIMH